MKSKTVTSSSSQNRIQTHLQVALFIGVPLLKTNTRLAWKYLYSFLEMETAIKAFAKHQAVDLHLFPPLRIKIHWEDLS